MKVEVPPPPVFFCKCEEVVERTGVIFLLNTKDSEVVEIREVINRLK
jgi:hypothetical protein